LVARGNAMIKENTMIRRMWAILRLRCPRCLHGKVFKGSFAMNDPCPECGLVFQREEGYFLGAMYVSYLLSSAVLLPLFFAGRALWPKLDSFLLVGLITLLYLPLVPAVFRYSRVVWMHFDRTLCAGDVSATAYEKAKWREIEERKT
jgi:uncharacterized protein (DUF983 family)